MRMALLLVSLTLLFLLGASSTGTASDKNSFIARYGGKYLVAIRDGMSIGICAGRPGTRSSLPVKLSYDSANVDPKDTEPDAEDPYECGGYLKEPVGRGEILKVREADPFGEDGMLAIFIENTSPHAVRRGVGAFEHQEYEIGLATLLVSAPDYDAAQKILDQWVAPFPTREEAAKEAAKYGNTGGVIVKQVKLGMTFAEVEAALGLPETKVDLGVKVLYKYKNITVEFHEGKVADVR